MPRWLNRLLSWLRVRKRRENDDRAGSSVPVSANGSQPLEAGSGEPDPSSIEAARRALNPSGRPIVSRAMIDRTVRNKMLHVPGTFIVQKTGHVYQVQKAGNWKLIGRTPRGETFDPGPGVAVVRDV